MSTESAKSTVRVAVSKALASALIGGFDEAAEEGRPLTQLQRIDVATMHIMAYSEAIEACNLLEFEATLKIADAFTPPDPFSRKV